MDLERPVTEVKGVGEQVAKKLAVLGIRTANDLIYHFPRRYDDYSHVLPINRTKPGPVTIQAVIKQAAGRYVRRGLHITEAVASDETGSVRLVWFNQPYRAEALKPEQAYFIAGDFGLRRQRMTIQNPSVELVSTFPVNTARIVPIYRETKGLKSGQIRKAVRELLPAIRSLSETLPAWLIEEEKLLGRAEALEQIHFPADTTTLRAAQRRLGFEEVFELTLAALMNKYELLKHEAVAVPFDVKLARSFVKHLPFHLTDDQRRVIWTVYQDLQKTAPMNRLVEGDVGSGKTVVATMAALMVLEHGYQTALMAPTELLARQHANTIFHLLEPLKLEKHVGLLVGGLSAAQKKQAQAKIASGEISFMVGTNALIQEKVDMHKLGLVVIDEQHRFGVEQRKKLEVKAGHMPHVLNMTATPIPRSLALTLYGELDISVIAMKPANRKPIKTQIIPLVKRSDTYKAMDSQLERGRQVFVVCPLIAESEITPARSAEKVYDELRTGVFKHRRVGLLHGRMKAPDKDKIMQAFVNHEYDVLVSTTVIEVGVDVPNATVMAVENAERFGLAQIHQLRGRV
ncbi:MAG TPA: ATP-dependent DNA helicase RecG, partial [Patescibacteria group bacterium]|nr:ATP-dependent DNA helicase RecG [Patescibacteria group bacterium]